MDAEVKKPDGDPFSLELRLLLEAIFETYHYDFRRYSPASLHRRVRRALDAFDLDTPSELQNELLHDESVFRRLLQYLTVQVSDLFRNPSYFLSFRETIVPVLKTYPSLKFWIAGASTGEEVYSFAIVLPEEGLLDRTIVYATDINPESLRKAELGIYEIERLQAFTANYRRAGGKATLSDYYATGYDGAIFDRALRKQTVFTDHSLATDNVFAEVHVVSCRNVLIYFDHELRDRALGLFRESLCRRGYLGLGARETLSFSAETHAFSDAVRNDRWYQKR
jgi:chemotaxis protein methyltransferase CheR